MLVAERDVTKSMLNFMRTAKLIPHDLCCNHRLFFHISFRRGGYHAEVN